MFEKSYYLEPDSKSPKAYMLLRRALEDTDRVAIVQFALRDKTRLGALRIRDEVLMLQALLWADEVREAEFPALDTSIRISAQEREMSAALVESMASDFEPEQFTDDYQTQLRQLIEAKLEKGDALDTEETFGAEAAASGTGEVIDLMEALKRSLDRKRGAGGRAAGDSDASESGGGSESEGDDAEEAGTAKPASGRARSGRSAAAKTGSSKAGTTKTGGTKARTAKSGQDEASSSEAKTPAKSGARSTSKPAAKSATKTAAAKSTASKTTASKTTAARPPPLGQGRAPENPGTPPSGLMSGRSGVSERRNEFALLFA